LMRNNVTMLTLGWSRRRSPCRPGVVALFRSWLESPMLRAFRGQRRKFTTIDD
jgi:hypothetical protein